MKRTGNLILCLCVTLANPITNHRAQPTGAPQWAAEAIWYQIFPDRFWNGDRGNDPKPEDMAGAWPTPQPENRQIHPWTADWYKLQPWERASGKDFYWNAGFRWYGGDLQGVHDRLDHLQKLGITAIYFNPLFESPSPHKYDTSMYHHIDNNFGPDPGGDKKNWARENPADPATWRWTAADKLFLSLIRECHRRGFKVIIGGAFNSVGATFWAFQDVVKKQQDSPYKDWFIIKKWDDPATPQNEFDYQAWVGAKDLPEIREDETGPPIGFRQHVQAIVRRWMDPDGDGNPADGIDGWQLDAADKVNISFWREFRRWVREINPQAYVTGEICWEDGRRRMLNAAPWLQGDTFDGVTNYRWAEAVKKFVIDVKTQGSVQGFVDSLQAIYREYPRAGLYAAQNLIDSHRVDRVASQIVNPDRWYDQAANPAQNPAYEVRPPGEQERAKQQLIAGLQMTLPGAPLIYYGDEAGLWGGDDPDCRKPMLWPDLRYEPESFHPLGRPVAAYDVRFQKALFDAYQKLITIRRANRALSVGEIEFFLTNEANKTLGYRRSFGDESIFVVLNNQATPTSIELDLTKYSGVGESLEDLVSGRRVSVANKTFQLSLSAYQMAILRP
jgi:glycosidase